MYEPGRAIFVHRAQRTGRILGTLLVALLFSVMLAPSPAVADRGNDGDGLVLPIQGKHYGKTSGAWSALWWRYVLEHPAAETPLADATGERCQIGQSGPVFFLVGVGGSGAVTRNQCVVPRGKAIFFPMVNAFDVHTPGDGLNTPRKVWRDLQVTGGF